ncbi:ABC transporter ATP-binding protein [Robertkochia aurantiaca]|uniref:ABC transporter ATP-binding protein n=1 Tax=Robertkochia aurantiaca TaxID=2873700 RepID=UPI001CD00EDC|nr:ATP-binding cassette domain-containing protein [Robertkochia sp. 3YJGBD-33]
MKTADTEHRTPGGTDRRRPVLEIKGLNKAFGSNKVLNDFNLTMYHGEIVVVMGRSGSGKSVMVKCLVGLMKPDSGEISILGRDMINISSGELDELRADIGFLFQGSALYDSMTVRQNLEFPLRHRKERKELTENMEEVVTTALDQVGLAHTLDLMPEELSGGMKRRVALARALILKPELMIYDEPTSGLDPITSKEIIQLMKHIQQTHNTSSMVITHDVDCARVIADRIVLLINGRNYAQGSYEDLAASEDEEIKAFFKT